VLVVAQSAPSQGGVREIHAHRNYIGGAVRCRQRSPCAVIAPTPTPIRRQWCGLRHVCAHGRGADNQERRRHDMLSSPTVRRRELGTALRKLRTEPSLTASERSYSSSSLTGKSQRWIHWTHASAPGSLQTEHYVREINQCPRRIPTLQRAPVRTATTPYHQGGLGPDNANVRQLVGLADENMYTQISKHDPAAVRTRVHA
jgi:hypothetical protein